MPSTLLLDLSMAMQALGVDNSAGRIADYLSNGRDALDEPEPIPVPKPSSVVIPSNGQVVLPEPPHTNGHAAQNGHVDLVQLPTRPCDCMGYRLGGAELCVHQHGA